MDLADRYVSATPEGVSLSIVLAGLGSRIVALLLDGIFLVVGSIVIYAAVVGILSLTPFDAVTKELIEEGVGMLLILFDLIGYFIFCEMFFSGRTLGKRMTGLRVTRANGQPVSFYASLLRNVLRLIDMLPTWYLVGAVSILATTKNQRLGDLAGGTIVVRERTAAVAALQTRPWTDAAQWAAPITGGAGWVPHSPAGPGVLPPELAHWDVSAVGPSEVMLAGMFLANRFGYTPDARAHLSVDLANRIWPLVAGAPSSLHPEQFLEAVVLAKSVRG